MKRWEIYLEIVLEVLIFLLLLFGIGYVLPKTMAFLWPLVAGWVITLIANPIVNFLEKKLNMSKRFGSALIVIVVLCILFGLLYVCGSVIVKETISLGKSIPDLYNSVTESIKSAWSSLTSMAGSFSPKIAGTIEKAGNTLQNEIGSYIAKIGSKNVGMVSGFAKSVTNGVIGVIVMFMSSYFFLVDREKLAKRWRKFDAPQFKEKVSLVKTHVFSALGGYLLAQLKLMGIVFAILFVGFLIDGVKYALLLAFLIAFLDALPFLGTGTALIPWAIVVMIDGRVGYGIGLLVIYVICLLARQILQPKIIGDTVGLSPLMTLALMYIGMKIAGIIGFIIAIVLGIIVMKLYELGLFDGIIRRIRHRFELLKETE